VTLQHVSILADNKSAIVLHRLLRWLQPGGSQPLAHM
jgi:hypothetical protein